MAIFAGILNASTSILTNFISIASNLDPNQLFGDDASYSNDLSSYVVYPCY